MKQLGVALIAVLAVGTMVGCCLFLLNTAFNRSEQSVVPASTSKPTNIATTPGARAAQRPPGMPRSKWTIVPFERSAMDDTTTIAFGLPADNTTSDWLNRRHIPSLIARCHGKRTAVIVNMELTAQPELGSYGLTTVRLRFDEAAPERQTWSDSTDDVAFFAPNPAALLRRIARAHRFRFGVNAFRGGEEVADFDVRGFEPFIGVIAKPCGWAP